MAKKIDTPAMYYVYYDNKVGTIFSVTNERTDKYEYGLEVSFEDIEPFLTGAWNFNDYVVGHKKTPNNKVVRAIMPVVDQNYGFRNNVFEWIQPNTKNPEMVVEWSYPTQSWIFSLSSDFKEHTKELFTTKLLFFVTLTDDFDFLIRTIPIDATELLDNESVSIPFTSNLELDIKQISISSKLAFKTYNLKITYE